MAPTRAPSQRNAKKNVSVSESDEESEEDSDGEVEKKKKSLIDDSTDEIEKIFCHRLDDKDQAEYMVKYKGKSFLHIGWEKESVFENDRFLKSKLQRYHKKGASLFDEIVDYYNPSFTEVLYFTILLLILKRSK